MLLVMVSLTHDFMGPSQCTCQGVIDRRDFSEIGPSSVLISTMTAAVNCNGNGNGVSRGWACEQDANARHHIQ